MPARVRPAVAAAVLAVVTVAVVAGVAGAGGSGGTNPGSTGTVKTVVLTARHSRFEPARINVAVGTTVRFVVRNLDPIDHELIVGDDATHRHHETGRDGHHQGNVPGEISVPAGTTAVTTYTATTPGDIVFACHVAGHFAYGMAGTLAVSRK
ncbi:MAG: multicopper oxidase domain-containing protein [Acidimicrobiales bacterium]